LRTKARATSFIAARPMAGDSNSLAHDARLEKRAVRGRPRFRGKAEITEGAEDIFVNTDSFIEGARSLDPVFKKKMFKRGLADGFQRIHQTEQRLVLVDWVCHKLGYESNKAMLQICAKWTKATTARAVRFWCRPSPHADQMQNCPRGFGALRREHPGAPELFQQAPQGTADAALFQHLSLLITELFSTGVSITRSRCERS